MSPAMEELYQYFVGHGQYAFSEGLRLGFLLAVECMGPELLRP